jgi:class 3 adenylate cyclase
MVTCTSCGQQNAEGVRFCGACGAPLVGKAPTAREERKRVSVLFCDLVGFTGRAESMDPEEVRALLQPYHARVRHELERYGGTVEKFIGDAVVALFGAPTAHEDDPERAVRAALAVRDGAGEDLHVRIGVATGEALVALDARPASGEGMASGDVVNTAARMQVAAPVDGVLADETTYRATQRAIEYREHSPIEAKGKAEPVPVWEAVAARSRLGLDVGERTSTPLVGRQLELDQLVTALARAREERAVQLVTLVGVPGIGKSRLVLELFRRVEEEQELIRWRQGRCLPYGEGVTLWAVGEIVKAQAGVLETDSAEEAQAKIGAAVGDSVPDGAEAAWVERHLRPFVGLEVASELSGESRDEAFAAWRRFFEGVADRDPLVLVIEDLQWADDLLLDFLDYLVEWATDVPLLVVGTARPELLTRRASWGGGKPNAVIQSLAPLSDEETAALAHGILGRTLLPAELQRSLVDNAGGNPLYAEEFARMLTERGAHETSGELPESVQGIIAARLDLLDPSEKALLQDAAVLGKVFWPTALENLTGDERWILERRLHELERRELVRRDRQSVVAGERQFAFSHLLVREVAYGQIPRARRAEKHAAVARWIDSLSPDRAEDRADMLAHHWAAALRYAEATGADTTDLADRTRDALVNAGDRSLKLNASAQAAEFYERALALRRTDALLLRYGRSLYLANDRRAEGALTQARDAMAAAADPAAAAFAEQMLSHVAWLAGDAGTTSRRTARAVSLIRPQPSSEVKAHVLAHAAADAFVADRIDEALELAREALALAEELGLDDLRVHSLTTIGSARWYSGDDDGRRDLERALEIGVAMRLREAGRAAHNLGVELFLRGDIAAYRELHAEGLAYDERFGNPALARFARGGLPAIAYLIGEWDGAQRAADAFLAECEAAPHYMEYQARVFRALIRLARDDVDGAVDDVERTLALLETQTDPQARSALGVAAVIFVELADRRAIPAALEAFDLRFIGQPEPFTTAFLPLLDAPTEIRERLGALLREPKTTTPWLDAGRAAFDGRFAEAAEIYARMPLRPAEALARVRAAEILVGEGRRAEADAQLERALAFWKRRDHSVGTRPVNVAQRAVGLGFSAYEGRPRRGQALRRLLLHNFSYRKRLI